MTSQNRKKYSEIDILILVRGEKEVKYAITPISIVLRNTYAAALNRFQKFDTKVKKTKQVLQMYLITKKGYIKKHFARCHHIFMNAEH